MFSIVIPVYNEVESLERLHQQLSELAEQHDYSMEMIFVDDGSADGSWEVIEALARSDDHVRGIRFRRNFGKAAALSAGFAAVRGELVFTLDADLQDDPREIPRFLEKMKEGLDVVSGWKQVRHDPWHKVLASRIFNGLVSCLTGVRLHDHNCGFKCYRHKIFDEVRLYGELHRFVPVLAAARGWKVGELIIKHRPRQFGRSKYGLMRIPKGFLDLMTVKFLTGYGQRPQHILGTAGLLAFTIGSLVLLLLSGEWVRTRLVYEASIDHMHLHERAMFYYSLGAVLLGAQFMSIGFLAELMTAFQGQDRMQYSIAATTSQDQAADSQNPSPQTLPLTDTAGPQQQ